MSAFRFIFVTTIKTRSEQKFIAVDALSSLLSEAIYTSCYDSSAPFTHTELKTI